MAIRDVIWTVSADGRSLSPNVPQDGGVQGEHNATCVIFKIPDGCPLANDKYQLYISCIDATGGYDKSPALTIKDGKVSFELPRAWTQFGGTNELTLVAEAAGEIVLELKARVVYRSRKTATQAERRLLDGFMQEAVNRAEDAAEKAESAEQNAADSATAAVDAARTAGEAASSAFSSQQAAVEAARQADQAANRAANLVDDCFIIGSKNLYNPETANRGYRLSLGRLIEDAEHITSDYIPYQPVDGSCTYCFSADGIGEDTQVMVALYDASLTFIKQMASPATEVIDIEDYEWTFSDGEKRRIAYLRLSFPIALTNVQFEVGDTVTAYEPYHRPLVKGENVQADAELDINSANPVQNRVVAGALNEFERVLGTVEADVEALKQNGGGTGTTEIVIGKNKLNVETVTEGKNFNPYTYEILDSTTASITDYIPVIAGETYTFQYLPSGYTTPSVVAPSRLVAYDDDGNVVEFKKDGETEIPYTIPDGVATVRFSAQIARLTADAQPMFFIGDGKAAEYEPYTETEVNTGGGTGGGSSSAVYAENVVGLDDAIADKVEKATAELDERVNGLEQNGGIETDTDVISKNLLNLDAVTRNQSFSANGDITSSSANSMSAVIPVTGGVTYSFQYGGQIFNTGIRWIVAYDDNGDRIDQQQYTNPYTVPTDATAIRFSAADSFLQVDKEPMFFEGTAVMVYESFEDAEFIPYNVKAENVIGLSEVCTEIAEKIVDDFIADIEYSFRNVDAVCDHYSCGGEKIEDPQKDDTTGWYDLNYVYDMYDALVTAYPDYVTKTLLGTVLPDTEALPIYRYDFTPKLPIDSKMDRLFKALYCSGTHGGEKTPIMVGVRFFKDLCENWRTQDLLRTLRFNCHFRVIPIVNPYGYVHTNDEVYGVNYEGKQQKLYSRCNENGVDLNRNFSNGWNNRNEYEYGHMNYPGPSPASETSTQLIERMTANEPFDFVIDHHTYGSFTSSVKAGYFVASTSRPGDIPFANMLSLWCNGKVVTNNTLITDLSKSYWQTMIGAGCGGYLYGCVPNGFCFENMHIWGTSQASDAGGVGAAMEELYPAQKFNAETIGALFHSAYVCFHKY